ncbi:hypothetical protein K439DRAFT_1566433 [Ramaria rubella]|nr:hypothetical protein K439DRAFT_1566433 [Ramaria rubella]
MSWQHNRRYAFGLVISQRTLTVHMFDRSGVVSSPSFDYHMEPVQFCAIVTGLASYEGERLGFDTSILNEDSQAILRVTEFVGRKRAKEVKYALTDLLYFASDLVGRGTICFATRMDADPERQYVLKDSWVAHDVLEGKESEASLIAHARNLGVSKGIPRIQYSEDVRIKGSTGVTRLDSVFSNRQTQSPDNAVERVHTRLIMEPYGIPLHHFSNRKELLMAYHDALQAHRNLYEIAGILHRDIKPENILINPDGEEGSRGILIDFDHAIRVADTSPYSTKRKIGTYFFMSERALKGETHTFMDDLESFYYVLVYIGRTYSGPRTMRKDAKTLQPMVNWDQPRASGVKKGFLIDEFYKANDWFGKPYQTLLERTHSIFNDLLREQLMASVGGHPPPVANSTEVYNMMVSYAREAVEDVLREQSESLNDTQGPENAEPDHNATDAAETDVPPRQLERLSWMLKRTPENENEMPIRPERKKISPTLAANRSRRSRATYMGSNIMLQELIQKNYKRPPK